LFTWNLIRSHSGASPALTRVVIKRSVSFVKARFSVATRTLSRASTAV